MHLGLPCNYINGGKCGFLIDVEPHVAVDLRELKRVDVAVRE